MGYIGSISHGTDEEKAVYERALGTVLKLGERIRDIERWKRARRRAELMRFWGLR